ncbi:hypothetical protein HYH03_013761 [Edaphochlamys debaryana]|uniref:Uncharacterized protein n=1 Tax=Edaphochlamys debaryana TaxID=47281 RepID=A0A835XMK6_9CHLO|nr:hypothetical protein HYH03_013761 [Edaphochlamys debaryana]|eukprot:KAG2487622.1 hypothetical protein HYH03_013761 [Edaphochlamys debaryana]
MARPSSAAAAAALCLALMAVVVAAGSSAAAEAATGGAARRDLFPRPDASDFEALSPEDRVVRSVAEAMAGVAAGAGAGAEAAGAALQSDLGLGPVLCDSLDCPSFRVLDRYPGGVELRRYDPASFTSTVLSLDDQCLERSAVIGFHRLLKYNLGDNEDSKKLPMTAPVLYGIDIDRKTSSRRELVFRERFSVSFFVPFRYQDSPPKPSSREVFLVDVDEVDVYSRAFDGYATEGRIRRVATDLLRDLHDDGRRVDCRTVYVAQYSPPFQPVFRYNEVWFLRRRKGRKEAGADTDATDAGRGKDDAGEEEEEEAAEECAKWLAQGAQEGGEEVVLPA